MPKPNPSPSTEKPTKGFTPHYLRKSPTSTPLPTKNRRTAEEEKNRRRHRYLVLLALGIILATLAILLHGIEAGWL